MSPDGQSVYATSNGLDWPANPSGLVVFNRDLGTGKLAWAGCFRDDGALNGCSKASGLDGAAGVALSADDDTAVYLEAKEPWFAEAYRRAWEWADFTGWRP